MTRKLFLLAFITIAATHIYKLGYIPKGLHIDEVSTAMNALFIAETGLDEHGMRFPVYFKALGDYKNPSHIYITALIFKLFGVSLFNLRVGAFIYFMLGLLALFYLAKELWPDSRISQMFLVLSIGFLPQYFTISRIAFAINGQFISISLALLFTYLSFEKDFRKPWNAIFPVLGGVFMGLSVYSYTTGRLISFLLMLGVGLLYLSRKNFIKMLTYTISAILSLIPYFYYYLTVPGTLDLHFRKISFLFNSELTKTQIISQFLELYVSYFLPAFQILIGDSNLRHHTGHGGMIFKTVYVLFFLGLLAFWVNYKKRVKEKRFWAVVLILLLLAPIGGAISTVDTAHSLRSFLMGIPIVLLATKGFHLLHSNLDAIKKYIVVGVVFLLLSIEVIDYQAHYFSDYVEESVTAFFSNGMLESLVLAVKRSPKEILVATLQDYHLPFYLETLDVPQEIAITPVLEPIPDNDVCLIYRNNKEIRKAKIGMFNDLYPSYVDFENDDWLVAMRCYD